VAAHEIGGGCYEFQVPPAAFGLERRGLGRLPGGPGTLDLVPATLEKELVVALERAPVLRGYAWRARGRAVPGAMSRPKREPRHAGRSRLPLHDGPDCERRPALRREGRVHADPGRQIAGLPALQRARPRGDDRRPLPRRRQRAAIAVELTPGGAIEGRARAKDGTPVVGAIIGITCGDGHPRTMRSGLDGVFRFEGLSEGSWLVLERDEEFRTDVTTTSSNSDESHIEWSCEVVAGRTTMHDLTLDR
jgi:hypothetical protein